MKQKYTPLDRILNFIGDEIKDGNPTFVKLQNDWIDQNQKYQNVINPPFPVPLAKIEQKTPPQ